MAIFLNFCFILYYFTYDLLFQCAHATLLRKIISSDQDLMSFVLFNTREMKNPTDFANIYILQDLERPGSEKVLKLEELMKSKFYSVFFLLQLVVFIIPFGV